MLIHLTKTQSFWFENLYIFDLRYFPLLSQFATLCSVWSCTVCWSGFSDSKMHLGSLFFKVEWLIEDSFCKFISLEKKSIEFFIFEIFSHLMIRFLILLVKLSIFHSLQPRMLWSIFDPAMDVPLSSVASQRGHLRARFSYPKICKGTIPNLIGRERRSFSALMFHQQKGQKKVYKNRFVKENVTVYRRFRLVFNAWLLCTPTVSFVTRLSIWLHQTVCQIFPHQTPGNSRFFGNSQFRKFL